jgi:hypothetical protein
VKKFKLDFAHQFYQRAEAQACPYWGATLLQEMPHEFCCKPFGDGTRNHLPPKDNQSLNRIVHLIELDINFTCISNRDS